LFSSDAFIIFELKIEQRELELESLQIKYDERITAKQVEVK
jgi:hypothetical protein